MGGWLWARTGAPKPEPFSGKWLVFVGCARAADTWRKVTLGLKKGGLGVAARVSTEEKARLWPRKFKDEPEHVISVYTTDWRDVEDVLRAGKALAAIAGPEDRELYYKSDEQTLAGEYAFSGPVALYRLRQPYVLLEPGKNLLALARDNINAARAIRALKSRP
jgi:Bles03-like protein